MEIKLGNRNIDIPTLTILTALLFISAYAFKYGESVFYGYPINYFALDLTEVINLSLKMLSCFLVIFIIIATPASIGKGYTDITAFVIAVMLIGISIYEGYGRIKSGAWDVVSLLDINVLILSGVLFVCFGKNCLMYCSIKSTLPFRLIVPLFILMIVFSFLLGVNYQTLPFAKVWAAESNGFVVAQFKDGFLLKSCVDNVASFQVIDAKGAKFYQLDSGNSVGLKIRCKLKHEMPR